MAADPSAARPLLHSRRLEGRRADQISVERQLVKAGHWALASGRVGVS